MKEPGLPGANRSTGTPKREGNPDIKKDLPGTRKRARPEGPDKVWMRRRATLPHPLECSTIAAPGLSYRVRNGTGRLTRAMTTAKLRQTA